MPSIRPILKVSFTRKTEKNEEEETKKNKKKGAQPDPIDIKKNFFSSLTLYTHKIFQTVFFK